MVEYTKLTESEIVNLKKVFKDNYNNTSEMIADKNGRKKGGGKGGAINHSSSILVNCNEKHKTQFTKKPSSKRVQKKLREQKN